MVPKIAREDAAVELDAEGRPSGVESEDVGEQIVDPFDPRLIDVVTEVRSLDVLMKRIESGQIDLDPDFQRSRGIWTAKKKSLLIESLLLRIPLPTFYVAEMEAGASLGENPWAVVDGIQRLSTIAEFIRPSVLVDSIVFERARIGPNAVVQKAILDKDVVIDAGASVGVDAEVDRGRGLTVTDSGITIVGKGVQISL